LAKALKGKVSERREEIVLAATELFYEYGFQKATMRDICGKIGITQAALYYHFLNKEEILYTIIERSSNNLYLLLRSCFSENKDPIEKLKNAIFQHILSIKQAREGAKIIIEDKRFLGGDLNRLVKEKEKAVFYLYRNQLKELQKTGLIKRCDLTVATFSIFGMINWLYHWYRPDKGLSLEKIAEELLEIIFRGLQEG
jgi:TetR/AcrR family transcriptional regulator, cholesterol catabolism regulator